MYSLKRDAMEAKFGKKVANQSVKADSGDSATSAVLPGKLIQVRQTDRGGQFCFEHAELEIRFLTNDLIEIQWLPGTLPIPYAIVCQEWEPVDITFEKKAFEKIASEKNTFEENKADEKNSAAELNWTIASSKLKIQVGQEGVLTIYDSNGIVIRTESPPRRLGEQWIHCARLQTEEHIYGLGERATTLNLRAAFNEQSLPKVYQMWNYDPGGRYPPGTDPMYLCIPVYMGLTEQFNYLIFYENSFRATFTFADEAIATFEGGALRYYFTVGDPPHLLERYTQLTGRAAMPARWALGYHQSRWGYRTEAAVREEVKTFQALHLPLSAIHLDIDCQAEHRPFTLDPLRFPKLSRFTQDLANSGIRLITINNPGIKYSYHSNLFLEGRILEAFCTYPNGELVVAPVWAGRMVFPDFTNPKVRAWWSRQYAYLLDVGVSGFWHDMNEPAAFVLWGDHSLPDVAQHCLEGRGGDHREAHNVYALLEAKAAYESLRQYRPENRPFIVSRSGWAGLQRYAWTWTGDTICTWDALRQTISTVIGLGLSGIPFTGPDIGGFQGNPSAELYLRWFQMATFFMFYRTHSSTSVLPRSPWSFGEPYLSLIRSCLQLRYQLLPYFYTLAWETAQKGYPPVRPVFWQDWHDRTLWDIDDAFCLGDALLVCPIVEPDQRSRSIQLPQGVWYNFWNDDCIEGRKTVELEAPLEQIPLLVKAGSILPMEYPCQESQQETDSDHSHFNQMYQLVLHIYPLESGESEGCLYSDAGDGDAKFRVDRFYLTRNPQYLELVWKHEGEYAFNHRSVQVRVHGVTIQQAWVDGRVVEIQDQQSQKQDSQTQQSQMQPHAQFIQCQHFHHLRLKLLENV